MKTYIIERNCCTSGNWIMCRGKAPPGRTVRVEHCRTVEKRIANKVLVDWKNYDAKIVTVNTDA